MVSNLSILVTHSETLESEKYVPPWMTPEFLYRTNYGPIGTEKEMRKVRKFIIDQYCALEARRKYKTLSHLRRHQWKSLLPYPWGRLPIRTVIQQGTFCCPDRLERRFLNKSVTSFQPPAMIGFLHPKLSLSSTRDIPPLTSRTGILRGFHLLK